MCRFESISYFDFINDQGFQDNFLGVYKALLAREAGVTIEQVFVTGLRNGSLIVDAEVQFTGDTGVWPLPHIRAQVGFAVAQPQNI
jgi:hypothetical protein